MRKLLFALFILTAGIPFNSHSQNAYDVESWIKQDMPSGYAILVTWSSGGTYYVKLALPNGTYADYYVNREDYLTRKGYAPQYTSIGIKKINKNMFQVVAQAEIFNTLIKHGFNLEKSLVLNTNGTDMEKHYFFTNGT